MKNEKWKILFDLPFSIGYFPFVIIIGAAMVGCSSGPRNFENENDRLRAENMQLHQQVDALKASTKSLSKQLEARAKAAGIKLPDGLLPSACTSITIDRFSGIVDDKLVRAYVQPLDAKQRFTQVIGKATLNLVAIPSQGPPVTIAHQTFDDKAFDAAYRSGLTGTHYSLEAPLTTQVPPGVTQLTLKITLEDIQSGLMLEAEKTIPTM